MKKIKSIKYSLISFALMMLVTVSCGEDWLEIEPVALDTPENLKGTGNAESLMLMSLKTAYNSVSYVFPWGSSNWVSLNCASGDVNTGGGAAGDRIEYEEMENLAKLNSASLAPRYLWEKNFRGIRNVNQMLSDNREVSGSPKVDAIKGEAKILRSYFYFDMVRLFGDVPYLTEDTLFNKEGKRTAANVVLDSLVVTIKANMQYMKRKAANGRFNYDAAHVLLAKIYMWQKNYNDAAAALDTVILGEKFNLLSNYGDVFSYSNMTNQEVIFNTKYEKDGSDSWDPWASQLNIDMKLTGIRDFVDKEKGPNSIVNGWGFLKPRKNLVDAYINANDNVRLNENIWLGDPESEYVSHFTSKLFERSVITDGALSYSKDLYGYEGFFRKKYTNYFGMVRKGDWVYMNFIIYRFADVLLLRAECSLNGASGNADEYINKVRTRVSLPSLTGTTMADLKLERRLELAFEFDRYFDLVRWGDAATVLAGNGYDPAKKGLLPVPQNEIDLSGGVLTQNPGY